ncbi:MAG TPA: hypothetical protein ENK06_04445, partial [Gammaproteobacteria bacterium]|nr:hypothetical protein [Gammaproteobacteria bacterium]
MTTTELKKTSNKAHAQTDRATQLMQLLSVIYEPISQTKFYLCAKAFGITQNNGKQLTPQSFGTIIKQLINKKVIVEQKKSYTCLPDQVEMLSKQALKAGYFEKMANIVQKKIPVSQRWRGPKASNWNQAVRELRIALYLQREKAAMKALEECEINFREYYEENPLIRICFKPFDPASFLKLPPAISHAAIAAAYQTTIDPLLDLDKLTDWLLDALHRQTYQLPSDKIYQASTLFLLKGDISRAKALLRYSGDYHRQMLSGWVSFLEGSNDLALEQFENALNTLKKTTKKRKLFIESLSGIFYLLALLRRNSPGDISRINDYIKIATKSQEYERHHEIYGALHFLADFMTNPKAVPYFEIRLKKWPASRSALEYFISVLVLFWARSHLTIKHVKSLTACVKDLENTDYQWLLGETSELLASISKKSTSAHAKRAKAIRKSCGFETIVNIVQVKTAWERTLDAMLKLDVEKNDKPVKKKSRLIWLLSLDDGWLTDVTIKEQKQKTNGGWSAGRKVALKRLLEEKETLDCLSDQDIRASRTIISDRDYWGISYRINPRQLLPALVGHPLLFLNDANNTPLELVKGSPEIVVTKKGQELRIKMRPSFAEGETTAFVKETETQWKIIETTAEQRQLASLIGSELIIPLEAKDKVLSSMSAIAPFVDIHSDIGGGVTEAETVDADSTLHVLLSPLDEGLKIEARTQVFGSKGPYYHPGEGGKTIIAEVDGKRLQTTRNLKQEQKNLQQIIDQCHELGNIEMYHNEWAIYDPETCLEILLELKQQENVIVSWPEGEKLKVQQTIGLSNLKMVIKKENDWFSAGGEIKLDDGQVLNMKRLIELTRQAKGRFISLADGQFLALTNTFKNRMEELQAFGEEKDEEILLHPLAALALDEMTNDVGSLKSDKNWKSYISRFHEAMKLEPEIPSTLQAELRDYQKEGYQWLVRLAHWGVGACLADDMGLGKTVQAIALLLHRATQGPALVVAPTSVAMNWMDEIERFAPTLNIIDYRESKRNEVLKSIAAFDVVICSYGLIQNGIEQIESVKWSTVILDEAQAIKNSATKRSQTIMRLKADVKIIMTGTPIENHLGELWNLFRFINPGLLGSMENF